MVGGKKYHRQGQVKAQGVAGWVKWWSCKRTRDLLVAEGFCGVGVRAGSWGQALGAVSLGSGFKKVNAARKAGHRCAYWVFVWNLLFGQERGEGSQQCV